MAGDKPWWIARDAATINGYTTELQAVNSWLEYSDLEWRAAYEDRRAGERRNKMTANAHINRLHSAKRLNVTRSAEETVRSRLIKRRAMPIVSATNADWDDRQCARKLSEYLRSEMMSARFERVSAGALHDALVVGSGVMQVVPSSHGVDFERVPRHEIHLEPAELEYNEPRQMHRRRRISRAVLAAKYPRHKAAIAQVSDERPPLRATSSGSTDQVTVWESWHLPSGSDADDGRYLVSVSGAVIFDGPWEQEVFPFAFFHWYQPSSGFWGTGLVEQMRGLQNGVNETFHSMTENARAVAGLQVFVRRGDKIRTEHLGGTRPHVIEYDGATPPAHVAAQPFSSGASWLFEKQIGLSYELTGVSQSSAASRSPLGTNASGVALDTMMDIESDRFAAQEQDYSHARIGVARCVVAVNRQAALGEKQRRVSYEKGGQRKLIDWGKIDLERDKFDYRLEATNFIPETRAGKLSAVAELAKTGVINDPSVISSLFEEPDLQQALRLQNSAMASVMAMLAVATDPDEPLPTPDPQQDLELLIKMAKAVYNDLLSQSASEEVLARVRDVLELSVATLKMGEAPAAMPGAIPPGPGGIGGSPLDAPMPPVPTAAPPMPPGALPQPMPQ